MRISYAITVNNETATLRTLLNTLKTNTDQADEIIALRDEKAVVSETENILNEFKVKTIRHALGNDYSSHKNFHIQQCTGDFIFAIDADEIPPVTLLGNNLKEIIESNPETEMFYVSRLNDYHGVTMDHARQWGWQLTQSPTLQRTVVQWPDPQSRIFKRDYPRIKWEGRLHETIKGHNEYAYLPRSEDYALHHIKTIEQQITTNRRYNKEFTQAENMGHSV